MGCISKEMSSHYVLSLVILQIPHAHEIFCFGGFHLQRFTTLLPLPWKSPLVGYFQEVVVSEHM